MSIAVPILALLLFLAAVWLGQRYARSRRGDGRENQAPAVTTPGGSSEAVPATEPLDARSDLYGLLEHRFAATWRVSQVASYAAFELDGRSVGLRFPHRPASREGQRGTRAELTTTLSLRTGAVTLARYGRGRVGVITDDPALRVLIRARLGDEGVLEARLREAGVDLFRLEPNGEAVIELVDVRNDTLVARIERVVELCRALDGQHGPSAEPGG